MHILAVIAAFFRRLFGIENKVTESTHSLNVGNRVSYSGRTGEVDSIDTDLDPNAPYFVKFDDSDEVEGTFSADELQVVE